MRFLLICTQIYFLIFGRAHIPSRFRRDVTTPIIPYYTSTGTAGPPQITSEAPQNESDNFDALTFDELESKVKEEETKLTNLKEEADKSKTDYDTKNDELTTKITECEKANANFTKAEEDLKVKGQPRKAYEQKKFDAMKQLAEDILPKITQDLGSAPTDIKDGKSADLEVELNTYTPAIVTALDARVKALQKLVPGINSRHFTKNNELDTAKGKFDKAFEQLAKKNCERTVKTSPPPNRRRRNDCVGVNNNIDIAQSALDAAQAAFDAVDLESTSTTSEINDSSRKLGRVPLLKIAVPLLKEKEEQEKIVSEANAQLTKSQEFIDAEDLVEEVRITVQECNRTKEIIVAEVDVLKKASEEKSSAYQRKESRVAAMKGEMKKKDPSAASSSSGMMIGIIVGILILSIVVALVVFFVIKKKNGGGGKGAGGGNKKPTMTTTTESKVETPTDDKPKDEKVKSEGDKSNSANPPKSSEKKTSENPKASEAGENKAACPPGVPTEDKPKEEKVKSEGKKKSSEKKTSENPRAAESAVNYVGGPNGYGVISSMFIEFGGIIRCLIGANHNEVPEHAQHDKLTAINNSEPILLKKACKVFIVPRKRKFIYPRKSKNPPSVPLHFKVEFGASMMRRVTSKELISILGEKPESLQELHAKIDELKGETTPFDTTLEGDAARTLLYKFMGQINQPQFVTGGKFPFTFKTCVAFALLAQSVMKEESIAPEHSGSFVPVGDVHGNYGDMMRMFARFQTATRPGYTQENFIFLGDYIDRGAQSLEVIMTLFALKCIYPKHYLLLRGNHENKPIFDQYGFMEELRSRMDNEGEAKALAALFNQTFGQMPHTATANKVYLMMHGGLGPSMFQKGKFILKDLLSRIIRPVLNFGAIQTVMALLWSDPAETGEFQPNKKRGSGYLYGPEVMTMLMKQTPIRWIIRGHQLVYNGVDFVGRNMTIFMSTNYEGKGNRAAFPKIESDGNMSLTIFVHEEEGDSPEVTYQKFLKDHDACRPTGCIPPVEDEPTIDYARNVSPC